MKPTVSILLSFIALPSALLAGENGLTSEALHRAASLKTARAAFETAFVVTQHASSQESLANITALAGSHGNSLSESLASAETHSQHGPASLTSFRLSQLQEAGVEFGSPVNGADAGHFTK